MKILFGVFIGVFVGMFIFVGLYWEVIETANAEQPQDHPCAIAEPISLFPEDVPFATLLTAAEPGGQRAPWKILTCWDTDMKQIIIQVSQRHIDSGWVRVECVPERPSREEQ